MSKISIENKILRTVRETICRHRMFNGGETVLMAVSGGPDSVALVHVLLSLAPEYSLRPAIAHLNHCLRGRDAERDAEFVADMGRRLDLTVYAERKNVRAFQVNRRVSPEEAARLVRYEFYDAVAAEHGFDKIALGHHSDDNAELVLLNLLRGSGPLGISGMTPVREGKFIRPLIHLKRSEILEYLSEKKIEYVTDVSNADLAFLRNRIRHHLIPELAAHYNPNITDALNRIAEIMRAEDCWFEQALEPVLQHCILSRASDEIVLSTAGLGRLERAAQRRIIRKAIFHIKKDLRRITLFHVDAVLDLLGNGPIEGRLNLPDGILAMKYTSELRILKQGIAGRRGGEPDRRGETEEYRYTMAAVGTLSIKETDARISLLEVGRDEMPDFGEIPAHRAYFDLDRLTFPLVVRNRRPGDRFSPLGVKGTQKLKDFFSDHKIPISERGKCPLLLSAGKIIWVAGHRIDNGVKVSPYTTRVLRAELFLA